MNSAQVLNLEAAKLVKELSVWMVTVQSAAIGLLIAKDTSVPAGVLPALHLSLAAFCVSVLAAAWNLSAVPWIVLQLDREEDPNLYEARLTSIRVLNRIPLWVMLTVQHWAFAFGIVSLVVMRLRM